MGNFTINAKVVSEYSFTVRASCEQEAAFLARDLIEAGYKLPHSQDMEIDCHLSKENKALWLKRF